MALFTESAGRGGRMNRRAKRKRQRAIRKARVQLEPAIRALRLLPIAQKAIEQGFRNYAKAVREYDRAIKERMMGINEQVH